MQICILLRIGLLLYNCPHTGFKQGKHKTHFAFDGTQFRKDICVYCIRSKLRAERGNLT